MATYRFHKRDDGYCRTYYKDAAGNRFCLMEDGYWGKSQVRWFSVVKQSGEPIRSIAMPDPAEFDRIELPSNPWRVEPVLTAPGTHASY